MERDPIEALRAAPAPPRHLEERTLLAVRAAGGMRPRVPHTRLALMAAAGVIFLAGLVAGRLWLPVLPADVSSHRSEYLLLLAGPVVPPSEGGTRSAEYAAWAQSVGGSGRDVRGAELSPRVRLVGDADAALAGSLATVGGYFIIEATSEAEAMRVAETCPHLRYGGVIEVRRLLP